ncbi:MAG: glycoside hydrolase family 3 protein [Selenomonadaceae bacterium]|nr:glycoside hydrolase family 3 protein [Selenomonadaceae bacterium]
MVNKLKLKLLSIAAIFFIIAFTGGCFANAENTADKNVAAVEKVEKPDPVEEILKSMSLTEKIGQMVLIGVHGTEMNDDIKFLLNQYHFGGIIFFDRNMQNKAQVKKFTEDLNAVANEKVPLFIALDEEGGRVARMKHDLQVMPSQQEVGLTGNVNEAYDCARLTAQNLREIGVNINFAPVADVGRDTRHFSEDPQTVAAFVESAAKGYESENFFYTLKHFPGIGKSKIDPHKAISDIEDSKAVLEVEDLPPFKKVIAENDNSKFMVMMGHLKYTALDDQNPASISPAIITGLLRDELKFSGVIITDDLQMGATDNYAENIGVKAVKAGVDIALVCHEYDAQQKLYLSILDAVKSGEISEERINESVRRILKMKLQLSN